MSLRGLRGMMRRRLARALFALALVLLPGCSRDSGVRGSGTIEMDEIDVASQVGGRLVRLMVNEGDSVRVGDTLAVLDRGEVSAELTAQIAETRRAQSQARDLAAGSRPSEVLMARAQLAAAAADRKLAQSEFERTEQLVKAQAVAQVDLDRARATRDAAVAHERAAAEQVQLQEAGFRRQQVTAAKQGAIAATAQLAGARSRADELVLVAPRSGVVLLRNFLPGELVGPGLAVLTLGAVDSLWMRVYVAAPLLTRIHLGDPVRVRPIGAGHDFAGRIVQINAQAEFTPRAALTEEEQANLVFGVKIELAPSGGALKAGLPAEAVLGRGPQ